MATTTLSPRDAIPLSAGMAPNATMSSHAEDTTLTSGSKVRRLLWLAAIVLAIDLSLVLHVPGLVCLAATAAAVAFCSRKLDALDADITAPPSETR